MRALEIMTGHVIYNPAYTYKFKLKTTFLLLTLTQSSLETLIENKEGLC